MEVFDLHTHKKGRLFAIFNQSIESVQSDSWYSLGLHPWYLDADWEGMLERMKSYSKDSNLMAIGECGFDLIKGTEVKIQVEAFEAQLDWAYEVELPIIMHQVKGLHLLQKILKEKKELPAIIWHGFNQKTSIGRSMLDFPIYFSFGNSLCKEGSNAQKFLKICPIDRIFFETDDSDLKIEQIFSQASLLLQIPVEVLISQVVDNWNKISKRKI